MPRRIAPVIVLVLMAAALLLGVRTALADAANHYLITSDSDNQTAGVPFTITVTAVDASDNVDTGYVGTIHFTSSDNNAILPNDYTFQVSDNGTHTFTIEFRTSGSQTVTVTDNANASLTSYKTWSVNAATAHHIMVSPDSSTITAGDTQAYTAEAFDQFNNSLGFVTENTTFSIAGDHGGSWSANTYTSAKAGTWIVTGTCGALSDNASLTVNVAGAHHIIISPDSSTITAGATQAYTAEAFDEFNNSLGFVTENTTFSIAGDHGGSWSANTYTSAKAGTWTVTGTCGALSDNASLTVNPAAAHHIVISPDTTSITAGDTQAYTAEAFDEFNNSLGFVTENTTFSIAGDHGGSWSANTYTSAKAGTWTVTGTYGALSDNASLTINAGSARHIVISPDTATITAGDTQAYTAEAFDQFNNSLGFVTENTTFSIAGEHGGSWSANAYTSAKAGTWTVTGTYSTLSDDASLTVNPGSAHHIIISPDSSTITAGNNQAYTAEAFDQFNNSLGNVTSTTSFSITPAAAGSWGGTDNATYTSAKAGTWTVTGAYGTLSDDASLTVNANVATRLDLTSNSTSAIAGIPFTVTITAYDIYGNIATGYTGTVHFSSSDTAAVLPDNHTFQAADSGRHEFSVTLCTSDNRTVTVADTVNTSLKDTGAWTVNPATSVDHIIISPDSASVTAGETKSYTAMAFDEFGNNRGDVTSATTFSITPAAGGSWGGTDNNTYTSAKAGTWTVTGTYGGTISDNATLTVTAGAVHHIVVSPNPKTITAGSNQPYSVEAFDQFNNSCGLVTTGLIFSIDEAAGGSWSGGTYTSAKAGTWTVTVTQGTRTATATLTVNPKAIEHYHVTSASYTQQVGVPFYVTVTAHDQYHNVVNDSTTQVTLTADPQLTVYFDTDGDGNYLDRKMTLRNGTFTVAARCNKAAANVVIYATSGDNENKKSGSSQPYTFTTAVVNKPPVATADTHKVDLDGTLNVAAPGVLGNDTDEAGGTLTAVLVTSVSHGTLTLSPDGSFSYTPEPGFTGTDSFTYKVNDGTSDSNVATVSITVNGASPAHGSGIPPGVWIGSILAAFLLGGVVYLYWRRSINSTPQAELDSVAALKVKMARMEERLAEQRLKEAQTGENDGENEGSKRHGSRWQRLREWINRLRRGR